jgi:hypothetical protein
MKGSKLTMVRSLKVFRLAIPVPAIAAATLALGCSSSNAKASSAAITSVDGNKTLSALTSTEIQQLCSDANKYLVSNLAPDYKVAACKAAAGTTATMSLPCNNASNGCINDPTNPGTFPGVVITGLCPSSGAPTIGCSLSVSQYTACLEEIVPAAKTAWAQFNDICNRLDAGSSTVNPPLMLQKSCQDVWQTCPELKPNVSNVTITG